MLTVGIVLMLHQWCTTESRRDGERNMVKEMKDMSDAHRIMEILKNIEGRWAFLARIARYVMDNSVQMALSRSSLGHALRSRGCA